MDVKSWREMVVQMAQTYDIRTSLDNEDTDDEWFECPECGEPILADDWALCEVLHKCPICEFNWEEDMNG